jgi:periplasmic protein TonB
MFDNFVVAKTQKRRRWKSLLISISVAVHAVALVALLIRGFWVIEKLALPKREVTVAVAPPPPPPPPPPAPSKKVEIKPDKIKRVKPMDSTQPVDKPIAPDEVDVEIVEDVGIEGGIEGGVSGGMIGGVVGGVLEGVPGGVIDEPPPPPPEPEKPRVVAQVAVEAQRISGEKSIQPDDNTKIQMQRDGRGQIEARYMMCLTKTGDIKSINQVKPSGYPEYDRRIQSKMGEWRYRPYVENGVPREVCTSITFIYKQI